MPTFGRLGDERSLDTPRIDSRKPRGECRPSPAIDRSPLGPQNRIGSMKNARFAFF